MAGRNIVVAASGISFFVVLALVLVVPHETLPAHEAKDGIDGMPPSSEIHAFFTDNYGMQQAQTFMHATAAALFLVFASALTRVTMESEKGGLWSRVAFAGAIATSAVVVVAMGFVSALLELHQSIDGRTLLFFYDAGWSLHFKVNYLVPVFLAAVGVAMLRGASAPKWIAWTGIAFATLTFLSTLGNLQQATYFLQFPAFFLLLLWVLMVAIVALTRGIGADKVTPAAAARPSAPLRPAPAQRQV